MRLRRVFTVTFAVVAIILLAVPGAFAVDEPPAETTTTGADGDVPAVVIPPEEPVEDEPPWTDRFLIPTLVATAVLVIAGTTLYYFARVKARYRVVGDGS